MGPAVRRDLGNLEGLRKFGILMTGKGPSTPQPSKWPPSITGWGRDDDKDKKKNRSLTEGTTSSMRFHRIDVKLLGLCQRGDALAELPGSPGKGAPCSGSEGPKGVTK